MHCAASLRYVTDMFLVSLAVADLLLLVVCIPLETLHYFVVTWDEEGAICKLSSYAEMVSAVASVLNLTAVSLERYIVIVYPMKTRSFCTMSNCRRALIIVWVVALILSIPVTITRGSAPITYYNNQTNITITIYYCWDGDERSGLPFAIAVYQCCIMFIFPCLLMVFCYSRVIKELWTSTKAVSAMTQISSTNFDSRVSISAAMRNSMYHSPFNSNSLLRNTVTHHKVTSTDDVRQARKQVIKMLILVIVLFLVCWGPRVIMQIFIKHGLALYSPAIYSIRVACMQLPFVHSCLNPIIYSLMSSNFRRMMVRSCTRHHPCSHVHFCCRTHSRRIPCRRDLPSSTSANYELTFNSELIRVGPVSAPSTCSTVYETNRTSPETDCDTMIHCDIIKLKC
uniref:G-protein coupled receptors family 1 profile domain-containing protein n=1 Tax=Strigamia maritima TaxID=126957 RepID=T1ITK8_STRMM